MKSLPEEEKMNVLRKRLADYTEDPDEDTWDAIAANLPKRPATWIRPAALVLLFIVYGSMMWVAGRFYEIKTAGNTEQNNDLSGSREQSMIIPSFEVCEVACEPNASQAKSIALLDYESKRSANDPVFPDEMERRTETKVASRLPDPVIANESIALLSDNDSSIRREEVLKNSEAYFTAGDTLQLPVDSLPDKKKTDTLKANKKQNKERKIHFSWYAMLTPSLAYQKVSPFKSDEVLITKLTPKGIFSKDRVGISADLGFQMDLPHRFILYSGLSYYQQNSTLTYSYQSDDVKEITASSGQFNYVLAPGSSLQTMHYEMKNAGLSAGLLYRLQGEKLRHSLGLGIQYQVGMLRQRENNSYKNAGSSYLNYQVLYRIEWAMNKKYHWFIQPNYSRLLLSHENLSIPLRIAPYKAGIGFGITYYMN